MSPARESAAIAEFQAIATERRKGKPSGRWQLPARVHPAIREAAKAHGVSIADVIGETRTKMPSRARKAAMYRLREMGHSLPEIGRMFGGRHHTSVMHAIRIVKRERIAAMIECRDPKSADYSGEWAI